MIHLVIEDGIARLQHEGHPLNALRMYTPDEIREAHQLLTEHIAKQGYDDYITPAEAQEIAKAEGYHIPNQTIYDACRRKTIPYATKRGKHWTMPRSQFNIWYTRWKERKTD